MACYRNQPRAFPTDLQKCTSLTCWLRSGNNASNRHLGLLITFSSLFITVCIAYSQSPGRDTYLTHGTPHSTSFDLGRNSARVSTDLATSTHKPRYVPRQMRKSKQKRIRPRRLCSAKLLRIKSPMESSFTTVNRNYKKVYAGEQWNKPSKTFV